MSYAVELFILIVLTSQGWSKTETHVQIIQDLNLGFKGDMTLSTVKSHNSRVMCVFDMWAIHREGQGKFGIEDIDATLCTHLILRSVRIKDKDGTRNFVLQNSETDEISEKLYKQAVGLKEQNSNLKVILSVGGWNESGKNFRMISSYNYTQFVFAKNVVKFLKERALDGLNVEWMWPEMYHSDKKSGDWYRVTNLIAWLSSALKANNLELALTLPGSISKIERSYNIPALERNVDYLIVMGHGLSGQAAVAASHDSPLLPLKGNTVGNTLDFILDKKIPPHKVILGIPFAGRTFRLRVAHVSRGGLGSAILQGVGLWSTSNTDGQVLNYNMTCSYLNEPFSKWTVYEDTEAKVPFMRDAERNWVSFENTKSVEAKVEFGEDRNLGGFAAWSITTDDFKGNFCGGGIKYPLLRTINHVLSKKANVALEVNPTPSTSTESLETTKMPTTLTPSTSPKSTPSTTTQKLTTQSASFEITTAHTVPPTSSIYTQATTTTKAKDTSQNASFDIAESQFTSPYPGKENEGEREMENTGIGSTVVYVVVTLLGMSLLLFLLFFLVRRKRRGNDNGLSKSEIRRFKEGYTYQGVKYKRKTQTTVLEQLQREDIICNSYDNSLEVPHTEYEICENEILGSGAYGVVLRGKVRNEVVAVKTMQPLSCKDHVLSLLEEIKIMAFVGQHENILRLIGANTALLHRGIVYVFVELCPLGSLEKYLKANKSSFVDLMKNDEFTCEKSKVEEEGGSEISSATLLLWAYQISNAMQFLECKKVIHGDLRTRNVRVCSKHLVKISDFGSSLKMYTYCNDIKDIKVSEAMSNCEEPLPWRHMSLETLTKLEFSAKSDVWAFGVTLWEIFSLGSIPYPGMSYTFGFTDDLVGGLRMSKPKYATTELYEKTMLQTWNENPQDRPSFEELCGFLRDAVERVSFQQEYMKVNIPTSQLTSL